MLLSALLLSSASLVAAGVQNVWWNITYVDDVNPDGLQPRRVIGVNGTWPPPPISINTSDSLVVHATNGLDKPTSLHHHGMFFNGTSWYDGAVGITQCGIPPGETLSYVVPINSSGQTGTYWVHAHFSGQYVDGLRAPVILAPEREVFADKYNDEFTVVLGDWYHDEHDILLKQFISIKNPGGAEPVPDAPLVYFAKGTSYLGPVASAAPGVYPTTSHVGFNQNATLPFEAGKTYRLRIINTSAFAAFYFWIDGHDMRIIEVDGTDVQESPIDVLSLTVAQRYSVLVTARNDTSPSNWAVHANMDTDMFDTVPDPLNPNATASITYSTSTNLTDLSPAGFDFYHDTNDTALVPVAPEAQLPPSTRTVELEVLFDTMNDGTNHAMFNGVTFNNPRVPTSFTQVQYADQNINQSAYGPQTFMLEHMDVVDIVLKNGDAGKHPFHIHGHKFQIVGRSTDYTSDDPELNPPLVEGQANPIRRDTVQVPSMSSVTMRFVADNPGSWFFHCHIDWHLSVGLAVVFVEATPALANSAVPQYLKDQCVAQGLLAQGNAAGNMDPTDLKGIITGPFQQLLGWRPKGIGAMFGCVLTATLGMISVAWYAIGNHDVSEEEIEEEVRRKQAQKASRAAWVKGVFKH